LGIQAANIKESRKFRGKQIENGVAHVRISPRGYESSWFMQHDRDWRGSPDQFAIHLNMVAHVGLCTKIRADAAVDRDATRRDQLIAMPARSDTGCGKKTIKAHNRDSQSVTS
jgi:hypothetical protein